MDTNNLELIATSAFGLEAVTAFEIKRLGYEIIKIENGKIIFKGDLEAIVKTNLWLRTADRVLLKMGEFKAVTFEELFQGVKALPWNELIPQTGTFPISKAKSLKSKLFSLSDIQAITKKAMVESLKEHYNTSWFSENGELYAIMVSILNDIVTITVDTSGQGLHKRGYRKNQLEAPIKETLAAGLVYISKWHPDRILYDPFCGSGTICIEAALIGKNIAPGLNREFVSMRWPIIPDSIWKSERQKTLQEIKQDRELNIQGSDNDYHAIKIAQDNAYEAGVDDCVKFQKLDFNEFNSSRKYCYVITNPPYGDRLGDTLLAKELSSLMGKKFIPQDTWSISVITSYPEFEKVYGRKFKNRKLYNGKIKTYFYQIQGPKPPSVIKAAEERKKLKESQLNTNS